MKKISLCMIVKNEAHVIERCINSVSKLIDYVFIVDTGSTDNTIEVIHQTIQKLNLGGEVIEQEWKNFAFNRSFALSELRKKDFIDYALMIDADEILNFDDTFNFSEFKEKMDKDLYDIQTNMGGISYPRPQLSSNKKSFRYEGVVHEFLTGDFESRDILSGCWNVPLQDSDRNKSGNKFEKDVELLKEAIESQPGEWFTSRYTFYLAQSLRDCQRREESLEAYLKRAQLGYWSEEIYVSYLNAGHLMKELNYSDNDIIQTYLKGHESFPSRLECLFYAIQYCRIKGLNRQGYILAKEGMKIPKPDIGLFLEDWIYSYGIVDEFSIVSYYSGDFQVSKECCERLLNEGKIPDYYRARVSGNLQFALEKIN